MAMIDGFTSNGIPGRNVTELPTDQKYAYSLHHIRQIRPTIRNSDIHIINPYLMLNQDKSGFENSVDPDQLASEASSFGPTLFFKL